MKFGTLLRTTSDDLVSKGPFCAPGCAPLGPAGARVPSPTPRQPTGHHAGADSSARRVATRLSLAAGLRSTATPAAPLPPLDLAAQHTPDARDAGIAEGRTQSAVGRVNCAARLPPAPPGAVRIHAVAPRAPPALTQRRPKQLAPRRRAATARAAPAVLAQRAAHACGGWGGEVSSDVDLRGGACASPPSAFPLHAHAARGHVPLRHVQAAQEAAQAPAGPLAGACAAAATGARCRWGWGKPAGAPGGRREAPGTEQAPAQRMSR